MPSPVPLPPPPAGLKSSVPPLIVPPDVAVSSKPPVDNVSVLPASDTDPEPVSSRPAIVLPPVIVSGVLSLTMS